MKTVADNQFLQLRGKVWTYYRRVPTHLVPALGRTFIKKSLGTADLKEARRLRNIETVRVDALFASIENSGSGGAASGGSTRARTADIPLAVLEEHVRAAVAALDRRATDRIAADPPTDGEELREMRMNTEVELGILKNPDDPRRDEWIASFGDRVLREAGADIQDRETLLRFGELVRRGLVEGQQRKLDRYDDNHGRGFHDTMFDPDRRPTTTFSTLVEVFQKEKLAAYREDGVRQMSVDKLAMVCEVILEIVGADTPVQQIDDDAVQHVRQTIARLPVNRVKHYPKLTIVQAIERADKDARARLAPLTQNSYLSIFREILATGMRKRMLAYNPADGIRSLKKDKVALHEKRMPLTLEQIKGFFEGDFYRSCAPGANQPYTKEDRVWRFWLPLLMLFTGSRPNELAQSLLEDVKTTKAGTHYLDLVEDEDDEQAKSLKTTTSRRRIPIHPELIRLGFLAFVEQRRKQAKKNGPRLFHELRPNKYGNLAAYPAKRFREVFMPAEIELEKRQTFYSIRHSVRDALRRAQVPAEALLVIGGWSQGQRLTADDYGDARNPDISRMWVEQIAYPGLDLSFLYPEGLVT